MPELPDITAYLEGLRRSILHTRLERVRLASPFVLRTVDPPVDALNGRTVLSLERIGKRIVIGFDDDLFAVIHLMIAGRLRWRSDADRAGPKPPAISPKLILATFEFPGGRLVFTEAGSKKRASLHILRGREALRALDPGGLDVMTASAKDFSATLTRENHTLKRALTDPRSFSGIGNAYSDEILHRARLSPLKLTHALTADEIHRLHEAVRTVLSEWTERLVAESADRFPEKVTAFRPGMAVHGRFGQPCPVCGSPIQRIVYAENEANYCARCQTGGRLLADRSLSRLLKSDWPRTLEELENSRGPDRSSR